MLQACTKVRNHMLVPLVENGLLINIAFVIIMHYMSHPKRNENTLALHVGKYSHIQAHSSIIEIQHTIMGACLCATFAMHLSSTSNSFKDIIAFILKRDHTHVKYVTQPLKPEEICTTI